MNIKDWISVLVMTVGLISTATAGGIWLGDQHYVTQRSMAVKEIRDLDDRITYLNIKIQQGEASNSEKIYIKTLEQRLRSLQSELEK